MSKEFIYEIGSVPVYGERRGSIFLKATLEGVEKNAYIFIPEKFSISGVIGPMRNGDASGACGQIDYTIREHLNKKEIQFTKGWDDVETFKLLELWDEYHLNDMQAGCEHQRAFGWKSYGEHPSEPCPTCGYKYGSSWLTKPLPKNILSTLEGFQKAQREPVWV